MASCPRIPPDFDDWVATAVVALREHGRVPEEPLLRAALIGIGVLDAISGGMTPAFTAVRDAVLAGDPQLLPTDRFDVGRIAGLDPAVAALVAAGERTSGTVS